VAAIANYLFVLLIIAMVKGDGGMNTGTEKEEGTRTKYPTKQIQEE
jgi:hypothetical protein